MDWDRLQSKQTSLLTWMSTQISASKNSVLRCLPRSEPDTHSQWNQIEHALRTVKRTGGVDGAAPAALLAALAGAAAVLHHHRDPARPARHPSPCDDTTRPLFLPRIRGPGSAGCLSIR